MAKKVKSMIKLQVPAAKATPAPPIGPALGQHGVNIPGFCKEFNERTQKDAGMIIPVVILSLIHISEPTRQAEISYAVFCLKKKKKQEEKKKKKNTNKISKRKIQ